MRLDDDLKNKEKKIIVHNTAENIEKLGIL